MTTSRLSNTQLTFFDGVGSDTNVVITSTDDTLTLSSTGGTVLLTGLTVPVSNEDAATKSYVDGLVVSGVTWKNSARLATDGLETGTFTYDGTSVISVTINNSIDGNTVVNGDRVLMKNMAVLTTGGTTPVQGDGIYIVSAVSTTVSCTLTRTSDAANGSPANGAAIFIYDGDAVSPLNNNSTWVVSNDSAVNWGATPVVEFTQMSADPVVVIGGTDTQVQYNNSGSLGGSAAITMNATELTVLTMANAAPINIGTTTLTDVSGDTTFALANSGSLNVNLYSQNTKNFTITQYGSLFDINSNGNTTFNTNTESFQGHVKFVNGPATSILTIDNNITAFTNIFMDSGSALQLQAGDDSGVVTIDVPATGVTSYLLTLPAVVGASGTVLKTTDAAGNTEWATASGTMLTLADTHMYVGNGSSEPEDGGTGLTYNRSNTSPVMTLGAAATGLTTLDIGTTATKSTISTTALGLMTISSVSNDITISTTTSGNVVIDSADQAATTSLTGTILDVSTQQLTVSAATTNLIYNSFAAPTVTDNTANDAITNTATVYIAGPVAPNSSGGFLPSITNSYGLLMGDGGAIGLESGDQDGVVTLAVPSSVTGYTMTLPGAVAATAGSILQSTTGGVTSWVSPASGMLTLPDKQMYVGNAGVPEASGANLTFDNGTGTGFVTMTIGASALETTTINIGSSGELKDILATGSGLFQIKADTGELFISSLNDTSIYTLNQTAADTAGGEVWIYPGDGLGTGAGGIMNMWSGAGGITGNGGLVGIVAADGGATSGNGGAISMVGGVAPTSGNGGAVSITSGASSVLGNGGAMSLTSGAATSGDGGSMTVTAGLSTSGNGGAVSLISGLGGAGTGAAIGGVGGFGGAFSINTGAGGAGGSNTAANGGVGAVSGAITIDTGAGGAGGASSEVNSNGGVGGAASDVTIGGGVGGAGGSGGSTSGTGGNGGVGGNITLQAGAGGVFGSGSVNGTAGVDGNLVFKLAAGTVSSTNNIIKFEAAGGGEIGRMENSGDFYAVTLNTTSDSRYKTNIEQIGNPLSIINKIEGYSYNWEEGFVGYNEKLQYGVLAQQLEDIGLENLVSGSEESKAVNYMGLIPLLIGAVKELSAKVDGYEKSRSGTRSASNKW
jgi:hypothetical protein